MKHSKIKLMVLAGAVALGLDTAPAYGQAPVITGLRRNGELVCTNLLAGSTASVVWTSSVLGPWTNSPPGLDAVTADTNGAIRVNVPLLSVSGPMFYRVRGVPALPPFPPFSAPSNMVWIAAGTFTMGSPASEPARSSNEGPQTQVTISQGFCMGKYEVTQAEYLAVRGSNPSYFKGDLSRPVEQVLRSDAVAYCTALTARERSAGRLPAGYGYRLPTEAEWEYACRAGTTTPFHYGNELRSGMANFNGHYEYLVGDPSHYNAGGIYLERTTSVGSYAPNAWGLYDMHGNVWEWCQDWYGAYPGGSVTDPQGPNTGPDRVVRGGTYLDYAYSSRSAYRYYIGTVYQFNFLGFRVVLAPGH